VACPRLNQCAVDTEVLTVRLPPLSIYLQPNINGYACIIYNTLIIPLVSIDINAYLA
jgi:hypothetical protein